MEVLPGQLHFENKKLRLPSQCECFCSPKRFRHKSNKKVLLRERKRHTARHVASARYVTVRGGYPVPGLGGVPHPRSRGGLPHPRLGGTPSQVQGGYLIPGPGGTPSRPCQGGTPSLPSPGVYPIPGPWGVPHPDLVRGGYPILTLSRGVPGVPPHPDLGWGTPPADLTGVPHPRDVD